MSHSHPTGQPGPSQPRPHPQPPQPNPALNTHPAVAALTGPSTYQQAHILVRSYLDLTPFLTAEERTLYMLDVVRYAAWQANVDLKLGQRRTEAEIMGIGLVGQVGLKHVQVAMASLAGPEEWKARRQEWEGFARTDMGVYVIERVMMMIAGAGEGAGIVGMVGKPPAQMNQMVMAAATTTAATTAATASANGKVGGGGQGADGDYMGKGRAKRIRVGDREDEEGEASGGPERVEEAEEEEENDEEEEEDTQRVPWEQILEGLKILDLEMRGLGRISDGLLLKDSLDLVGIRLESMKEVFVPLVSWINNTLMDVKGVEQKLTAMEVKGTSIFSGNGGTEGSLEEGSEADETLRLFFLEFTSLLATLDALQKMFREHGIPSYLSPYHSTLERLNSMEDMLLQEIDMKTVSGKDPAVNEELLAKFKSVMKTLDALENMYAADLKFANLSL